MTKDELIAEVKTATGIITKEADEAVNATLESIKETVSKGEEVSLKGFGTFYISNRSARTGRNPKTGEAINIAASKSVKFRPSKVLKDEIA